MENYKCAYLLPDFSKDSKINFSIERQTIADKIVRHWHEFYEIFIVIKGIGHYILNNQTYELIEGTATLIHPGDFHEIIVQDSEPLEIIDINASHPFIASSIWNSLRYNNRILVKHLSGDDFSAVKYICDILLAEYNDFDLTNIPVLQTGFAWLLLSTFRSKVSLQNEDIKKGEIESAIAYINNKFMKPISLAEVADYVHLSRGYFSQFFKKHVGITFQEYLKDVRLNYACNLMKITELSISEICFRSGFNSLTYFSRAFKRKFDDSPEQFRKRRCT